MAQDIERFTFYRSYFDAIKSLDGEQRLLLYDAILWYAFEGKSPNDLPAVLNTCFSFVRPNIDKSIAWHKANTENGRKGGRPKNQTQTELKATEKQIETERKPNAKADKDKDKDKDKREKVRDEEKEVSCSTELSDTQTAFASFWKSYPKKMGKKDAEKAFAKAIQRTDLNTMLAALGKQRNSQEWQRNGGQYIPYPATWLNGDRWADDLTTGGGTNGGLGSDPLGGLRIGLHL